MLETVIFANFSNKFGFIAPDVSILFENKIVNYIIIDLESFESFYAFLFEYINIKIALSYYHIN